MKISIMQSMAGVKTWLSCLTLKLVLRFSFDRPGNNSKVGSAARHHGADVYTRLQGDWTKVLRCNATGRIS